MDRTPPKFLKYCNVSGYVSHKIASKVIDQELLGRMSRADRIRTLRPAGDTFPIHWLYYTKDVIFHGGGEQGRDAESRLTLNA